MRTKLALRASKHFEWEKLKMHKHYWSEDLKRKAHFRDMEKINIKWAF